MSLIVPSNVRPSFAVGYARSAAESDNPGLWDGLVAAYCPALGPTGSVLRDLVGQQDGTLQNMEAADWQVHDSMGYTLSLGGTDEFVQLPGSFTPSEPRTIMAWARTTDTTLSRAYCWADNTQTDRMLAVSIRGNNPFAYTVRYDDNSTVSSTRTAVQGQWYCLAGVSRASNDHELYIDGELDGSGAGDTTFSTLNDGALGKETDSGPRYLTGNIGPAYYWERALSGDELKQLCADPLAPFRRRIHIPLVTAAAPPVGTGVKHPLAGPFSLPLQGSLG